jgi:hypothetical protein
MTPASRPATLEPVRFGEFLRDRSLITDEQWLAALAAHWSIAMKPPAPGSRRPRIGKQIVDAGYLPAEIVEQEARAFHDDLEVVEIDDVSPRSERMTAPIPRVTFSAGRS